MDINSKINMSLDEIIKLKRANNKAEKKGAPAKGPKGRGKAKFGKPTKDAGPSRKQDQYVLGAKTALVGVSRRTSVSSRPPPTQRLVLHP
uniref:Uncharacterized protein n=1 Tax=Steinernema glaseri TaxID=37863 RepID=A0A1I7Z142_9BILA